MAKTVDNKQLNDALKAVAPTSDAVLQRVQIQRKRLYTELLGHILSNSCAVGITVLCICSALFLISSVMLVTGVLTADQIDALHISSICTAVFPMVTIIPMDGMDLNGVLAVLMGSAGLLFIFIGYILQQFRLVFREISRKEQIFAEQYIRRFRTISIACAAIGVCQPLFLLVAALSLFVSCVFNYGSDVEYQAKRTISDQENVILTFAEITEAKSEQTGQHVKRVSEYSRILAEGLHLSVDEVEVIRIASMMHDIGKLMIDNSILEKKGKLTDAEFEIMKTHVTAGEKMLHNTSGEVLEVARRIALDHHERWDGTGHLKKSGEAISLEGRIVAVADVFDALVSRRSYKSAWSPEKAKNEILSQRGRQFDPAVVDAFQVCYPKFLRIMEQYKDELV